MKSATTAIEREVKLEVDLGFELPDLRGAAVHTVRRPNRQLRAAYLDTADLRLWHQGITFRHRLGEGDDGTWTVKLPAGVGATLDRTEVSWEGPRDELPDEAVRLLRGIVRRSVLQQVAELVATRGRLSLSHSDGTRWGELDDDLVTVIGGPRDGLRFRQLELELVSSVPTVAETADLVLRQLTAAGARREDEPKLAKALGLDAGSPIKHLVDQVDRTSSVGSVVQASIAGALDRILDHDCRLRLDPSRPDPHAVHQARVATRRLRSDLKTLGPVLDPVWSAHIRSELKWLGTVLGQVRDVDVLAEHLAENQGDGPTDTEGRRELRTHLTNQRTIASQALGHALGADRYLDLLDGLHTGANAPPFHDGPLPGGGNRRVGADDLARHDLRLLVGHRWRALRRKVRKAGRRPTDRQLHQVRIGAKELRYAAEMATPIVGGAARRTAKSAEQLQTVLGEHHDAVTAEVWLRRAASGVAPAAAFTAGRLAAERRRDQKKLRHRWRGVWDVVDRKKSRRWLR
jgi:CHAD domain-containing protein